MVGSKTAYAFLLLGLVDAGTRAEDAYCNGLSDTIGDGVCDMENNNEVCGYDGGDCCECTIETPLEDFGFEHFFLCLDPDSDCFDPLVEIYPSCIHGEIRAIGDGFCDLANNNEECEYDGGDCCVCSNNSDEYYSSSGSSSSLLLCVDPEDQCYDFDAAALQSNCIDGYIRGIGDGYCSLENNNERCQYDGGDCCDCTRTISGSSSYSVGSATLSFCKNSSSPCYDSTADRSSCANGLNEGIGDGRCDEENNSQGCLYDGGDCCPGTCVHGLPFECGINGYACSNTNSSCSAGVKAEWTIENTQQARALAEAVRCPDGLFNVSWKGKVIIDEPISIGNGTVLIVTSIDADAAIDGDGTTRLFTVQGASLHLRNITLTNGNASNGGAIFASRSRLTFNHVPFVNNTASKRGGALYISNGAIVSFGGETAFINNAASDGGALYATGVSSVVWGGNTCFRNNVANASRSGGDTLLSVNDDVCSGSGGALYVSNRSSAVWTAISYFVSNSAESNGGAVYLSNRGSISLAATSYFITNRAHENGGAVYTDTSSRSSWAAGSRFSGNNAGFDGGVMYATGGSEAAWMAKSLFSANNAGSDGGAIYAASNGTLSWGTNALFDSNTAAYGGAVFITNGAAIEWGGKMIFASNKADSDGGAVGSRALDSELTTSDNGRVRIVNDEGSSIFIKGATIFVQNTCRASGGGMAIVQSLAVSFESENVTFLRNNASISGGGVFVTGTGIGVIFNNVTFTENSAQTGGGVYSTGSGTAVTVDEVDQQVDNPTKFIGCTFTDNIAFATGGAVDTSSGQDEFTQSSFERNKARVGGALRLAGTASIDNCSFVENMSEPDEGPAVSNVGYLSAITYTVFRDNVFDCQLEEFLQFEPSKNTFSAVCNECYDNDECDFGEKGAPSCISLSDANVEHAMSPGGITTLDELEIESGYWRAANNSLNVFECFNGGACNGGVTGEPKYCNEGYKGPYCSVCERNYVRSLSFTCRKCSSQTVSIIIAIVSTLLAIAFGLAILSYLVSAEAGGAGRGIVDSMTRWIPMQSVKIIVVAWQILTQFASVANVTFPNVYQTFLEGVDLLNFDLSWIVSTGCFLELNFHHRLLWTTIAPLVSMCFLGVTYTIAVHRNHRSFETAIRAIQTARQKHVSMALLLTFFVYSSVSSVVFQMFACESLDDNKRYLRADYSIECDSSTHHGFQIYAGIMILLYPVGIPAFYASLLFRNRSQLLKNKDRNQTLVVSSTSDLWEPYKPQRFYYEVIECARRILLAGVVVFIYPNTAAQIAVTLAIAIVFVFLSEGMAPYESQWDSWISRVGHAVVFASMYLALLLKVNVSDEANSSQEMFEITLVAAHGFMVIAVILEAVIMALSVRKEKQEEDPRPRLRRSSASIIMIQASLVEEGDMCKDEL